MKVLTHALIALALLIMATPAIATIEVEGDAYINYSSMYLWRGFDLSNADSVVQGGMDVSFKGLTLSYWSNYQIEDTEMDETDFVIDYSFTVADIVGISVGHILYSLNGDDTGEVYAGVSLDTILAPTLTVYYDYDQFDGDAFTTFSIGHSFDLAENLSLSLGALASYADNDDYSDLHNAEFSAALDYAVTEQISITPSIIASTPISNDAEDVLDDEVMGSLALTITF